MFAWLKKLLTEDRRSGHQVAMEMWHMLERKKEEPLDVYNLIAGIRGVELETLMDWNPDEAASWSCVRCDYWTSDNPPPEKCPRCYGWSAERIERNRLLLELRRG